MNYIKKFKTVLLCVILTVGLLAVPAYAENSVNESNYDVGLAVTAVRDTSNPDYVDIAIHINKNAGIHSLQFEVNYDSDVYELVDNNKLDANGYFFSQDLSAYPYSCNWFSPNAALYTNCDEFVTLRFKVKESAPVGNYEFTLANIKAKQFIDSNERKMSVFAGSATDSIDGETSADESNYDVVLAMTAVRDASNPDYLDVAISLNKNTGIHSLQFKVNYDSDAYELVDNNKLDANGYFFSQDLSVYPYSCNWFSPDAVLYTGCDEFITLRFKVKESAYAGNYEFSLANIKAKQSSDGIEIKKSVYSGSVTDSIEGSSISGNIFSWDQTDNIRTYIYCEDSSDKDIADDIMLNKGQNAYDQASTEAPVASTDSNCKYTYQSAINLSVDSSSDPRTYKLVVYKPGYALDIRSISVSNSGTTIEEGIFLSKYGDVSNNGKINITDVAWLTHHLANWEEYKNIDLKAADVDGNGEVNLRDIAILERHLAHWQGYEELPYVE